MPKKNRKLLAKYGKDIARYVFWTYFSFLLVYYFTIDNKIPCYLGYLFWLFLGIHTGYFLASFSSNSDFKF
jgi:hypothetical protein